MTNLSPSEVQPLRTGTVSVFTARKQRGWQGTQRPWEEVEDDFSAAAWCKRQSYSRKTAANEAVRRRSTSAFLTEAYLHVENT